MATRLASIAGNGVVSCLRHLAFHSCNVVCHCANPETLTLFLSPDRSDLDQVNCKQFASVHTGRRPKHLPELT